MLKRQWKRYIQRKKQEEKEKLEQIKKMIDNLSLDELCELYDKTRQAPS